MAAIKINKSNKSDTIMLQTSLGIVNEIYAGNNKWLKSKMDGTSAMRWTPIKVKMEETI